MLGSAFPLDNRHDQHLLGAVRKLRDLDAHPGIYDEVVHLPTNLGGLGIPSFADCSGHARAAANDLADSVLSTFIPSIAPEDDPVSQYARCRTMFEDTHKQLFHRLDTAQRITLIESGSTLGRRWLSTLPTSPQLNIENASLMLNLQIRTLSLTERPCPARGCKQTMSLGHPERCALLNGSFHFRHDRVKNAVAAGYRAIPDSEVVVEPIVQVEVAIVTTSLSHLLRIALYLRFSST